MQTSEILFIIITIVAVAVAIKFFFSVKQDEEYTINLVIEEDNIPVKSPEEVVAKPKRRYKKRKKKVAAPTVAPVAQVVPAVKKAVGRPKKTT